MRAIESLKSNNDITISHLQFFPCVKQLVLFEKEKSISIDIYENFPKQTFRNRTTVLSSQGTLNIIVPTQKNGKDKVLMRDVEISYRQKWNTEAWRTIFSCYGKSPFFIFYADKIKDILFKQHKYLIDLNIEIFDLLKQSMHLSCDLYVTSQYIERKENNFRDEFLCKNRVADGKDLQPYYQCFSIPKQTQSDNHSIHTTLSGFQTNLSSLDLLFNLGNESGEYIRNAIR